MTTQSSFVSHMLLLGFCFCCSFSYNLKSLNTLESNYLFIFIITCVLPEVSYYNKCCSPSCAYVAISARKQRKMCWPEKTAIVTKAAAV